MTKHGKGLPLRRQRDGVEDALLIRSAESLGRMIGSLQRQLEGASKKFSAADAMKFFGADGDGHAGDGHKTDGHKPRNAGGAVKESRRMARNGQAKGGSKSGVTKVRSTADRKSKRAAPSAAAKKTAGRSRSGASKASKSTRSR